MVLSWLLFEVFALFAEFSIFVPGVLRERKHTNGTARLKTLAVLRIDLFRASYSFFRASGSGLGFFALEPLPSA